MREAHRQILPQFLGESAEKSAKVRQDCAKVPQEDGRACRYAPLHTRAAAEIKWDVAAGKPLIFSEFGAEALSGKRGPDDVAHEWSEDYQAAVYRQNLEMFRNIPNLRGTAPWVLFDFRSPYRRQQTYQNGWNRKGLLGDKGQRKMAWQVMKHFHDMK